MGAHKEVLRVTSQLKSFNELKLSKNLLTLNQIKLIFKFILNSKTIKKKEASYNDSSNYLEKSN